MSLPRRATALAVCAVAGAMGLAACSKASSSGSISNASGAFGSVPAASGTPQAGTVTWAESPGSAPTWIFPVTPGANLSVTTTSSFQDEMWRPLYWFPNGVSPTEVPAMSLAYPPTYSNGDKTVTIRMKTNYRWSDGQPVTASDALFYIDEVRAAVRESGANWGYYTPSIGLPDQVVSASTQNATTLVLKLNKPVNPVWFTDDELYYVQPIPVHAWAKASANGPIIDFTNPANAKKIYDFLAKESGSTGSYATNPLWQVVDGPYRLTSFNNTTGAYTMVPNPKYGGPTSAKVPTLQAIPYTSDTAEFNAVLSHSIDIGYMPQTDVPQLSAVKAAGYHVFGYPDFGFAYVNYNFADKTGDFNNIINQLYVRQALAHLENEEGYIKAFFHGAGGLAYGPIPAVPTSPYAPANALTNPYPYSVSTAVSLLKSHGWNVVPGGTTTCAKPGTGPGRVRRRDPGRHQAGVQRALRQRPGHHRRAAHRLGVGREEGRHRHHAAERHVQPRHHRRQRPGVAEDHQPVGDVGVRRVHRRELPDDDGHLHHRRILQRRFLQRRRGEQADQRVGHQRQPQRRQG